MQFLDQNHKIYFKKITQGEKAQKQHLNTKLMQQIYTK